MGVYGLLPITAAAALSSLLFDIARVIRKNTQIPPVILDFIFWTSATVIMSAALLYANNGKIRGYEIIAAAAASALYFSTVSLPITRALTAAVKFICKLIFR